MSHADVLAIANLFVFDKEESQGWGIKTTLLYFNSFQQLINQLIKKQVISE